MSVHSLELVRVGQVGQNNSCSGDEGGETTTGDQCRRGFLLAAFWGNLHFRLNSPDIRFSVLVNRDTPFCDIIDIFLSENNSAGYNGPGNRSCKWGKKSENISKMPISRKYVVVVNDANS
jgi:hypothetical protein